MKRKATTRIGLFLAGVAATVSTNAADLPDARASDPNTLQWMVGFPPPPDK